MYIKENHGIAHEGSVAGDIRMTVKKQQLGSVKPTSKKHRKQSQADEQLVVLFLAADPVNMAPLAIQQEIHDIENELRQAKERDRFVMRYQFAARPADVSRSLLNEQPRIIHFSGHGTSAGSLCFQDESGKVQSVAPDALAALFAEFQGQIDCVLMNACFTAVQAEAISRTVPCVIGMQKEVGDKAAIAFAAGFYQALGAGRTPEEAFRFGCAQIRLQGIPEHLTPTLVKSLAAAVLESQGNVVREQ